MLLLLLRQRQSVDELIMMVLCVSAPPAGADAGLPGSDQSCRCSTKVSMNRTYLQNGVLIIARLLLDYCTITAC